LLPPLILFNHESPRRGETFVTRKIVRGIANIFKGLQDKLYLGNLDARRDWGYAKDYADGMWRILQHPHPDDFILATNETHSVREFVEAAAKIVGIEIEWHGQGLKEQGINKVTGKSIIEVDPVYHRPAEVDLLIGDYSKAKKWLGWEPSIKFDGLVELMMKAELKEHDQVN
jgi:GDPmannose 4,6-dehydratase